MGLELTVLGDGGFPDPERALREPDGLLAVGGDLSPARLLDAYAHGIFPWYSEGQPILWWSPDPRMVFRTDGVHLSRRFRRRRRRTAPGPGRDRDHGGDAGGVPGTAPSRPRALDRGS